MRIAVVGTSGSGKSTLARRLAARLGAPAIELDALNWGPGWLDSSKADPDAFARRVSAAVAGEHWVTDGNYSGVLPIILRRASDVVWLDFDRSVVMRRVVLRSLLRSVSGRELWPGTGNREDWRRWLDQDHPIRWAWDTHKGRRARYETMLARPSFAHLTVHRLRRPRETDVLVEKLAGKAKAAP